ncbi:tetratricopeptide repeat protein (macronuclear) [Tetrahymena thermophila SB210]|uniref:Tetratricopeptide repeat protein n=1 Tax=Tetrahymena thermophila (strain SB210) TaxID=312017 RepID=Q23WP0_TETTS|nr:tetratricopeptide repeat protein [Tetrahymena thermophila SB210]EAS00940.3 tetratricopeptide repeat protein [Tetrahymena thermophila SB210]|eukprot:XP_001021185.3 tetratricopeptide repeat protein [Tetrahymena thermophila SB210]
MQQNQDYKQFEVKENNKQQRKQKEDSQNTIQKCKKQSKLCQTLESNESSFNYQIINEEEKKENYLKLCFDDEYTINKNQKKLNKEKMIPSRNNELNQIKEKKIQQTNKQEPKNQMMDDSKNQENIEKQILIKQQSKENQINIQELKSNDNCEKKLQEQNDLYQNTKILELKQQSLEIIKKFLDNKVLLEYSKKKENLSQQKHQESRDFVIFNPLSSMKDQQINQNDKQNDSNKLNSEQKQEILNYDNSQGQKDYQNFDQFDQKQLNIENSLEKMDISQCSDKKCESIQGFQNYEGECALSQILFQGHHINMNVKENQKAAFVEMIRIKLEEKGLEITKFINSGGEADILECRSKDGIFVLRFLFYKNEKNKEEIEKEYKIISSIKKQFNLTSQKDKIDIPDSNLIIILTDFYQQSLHEYLTNSLNKFDQDTFVSFIYDMIFGLIELRYYNIQHFDIKPANILLDTNLKLYFNDFGLSNKLKYGESFVPLGHTSAFSPQEQQDYQQIDNYQSDIFSLGKTFEVVMKAFSKQNINLYNQQQKFFDNFKNLIVLMTKKEPQDRIKCDELLLRFTGFLRDFNVQQNTFSKEAQKVKLILQYIQDQVQIIDKDQEFIKDVLYSYSFVQLKLNLFFYDINFSQDIDLDNEDSLINILSQNPNKVFLFGLYCIGFAYYIQSKYYQSAKILNTCFQIGIQLQEDFNFLIDLANAIGACYINLGLYKEAYDLYKASIKQLDKINDKLLLPVVCQICSNFAECLLTAGKLDEAEKLYNQSIKIFKELNDTSSYYYSQILNNIATYQNDQKKYQDALQNYTQCLQVKRNLLKNDIHPSIAITLHNIGTFYTELFSLSQNENIDEEELNKFLKQASEQNNGFPQQPIKIENLSQLQLYFYNLAHVNIQQSIDIMKQIYIKKSYYLLSKFQNSLATLYMAKGEYEQALNQMNEVLQMNELIQDPYQTALISFNLADMYLQIQQYENAKKYCLQAINILQQNDMLNCEIYSVALNSYGKILEILKSNEAIDYLIKAVEIKEKYKNNQSSYELDEFIQDVIEYSDKLDQSQIKSYYEKLDFFAEFLKKIQSNLKLSDKVMKIIIQMNDEEYDILYQKFSEEQKKYLQQFLLGPK